MSFCCRPVDHVDCSFFRFRLHELAVGAGDCKLLECPASGDQSAIDLHEKIDKAMATRDAAALKEAAGALKELLFFVEGGN